MMGSVRKQDTPQHKYVIQRQGYKDNSVYVKEDEEPEADYKPGGYHPVALNDSFSGYTVIQKLGWGHFSTVWLCRHSDQYVALKIVKSAKHYTETAMDEIRLLQRVNQGEGPNKKYVVHLIDSFNIKGPFGKHVAMVFETLGENLLTVIRRYEHRGLPLSLVKKYTREILAGLDFLHRECGIIHTDIKPENVLLTLSNDKLKSRYLSDSIEGALSQISLNDAEHCKLADLGNACFVNHHFTSDIQTRQYRSPEVILGAKYDQTCDLWSVACIAFELLVGDYLFDPQKGDRYSKDEDHLAQIMELTGSPLPVQFALSGKYSREYFNSKGQLRHIHKLKFWKLEQVLMEKYSIASTLAREISEFLTLMLQPQPQMRKSAQQLLEHPFLMDSVADK